MAFRFGLVLLAFVVCLNINSVVSDDGKSSILSTLKVFPALLIVFFSLGLGVDYNVEA